MELDNSNHKEILIDKTGFRKHFTASNWAEYNRLFFDHLAPKYDALNQVLTFGQQNRYKTKAVKRSRIKSGDLVLDICTGTGDIAQLIANEFPNCHVIGVDVSRKMLEIGCKKLNNFKNVEFQYGDAQSLPFEAKMFDAVFMSYGLRNLTNLKLGIQEMKRVVKPGGVINIIDLGKPKNPIKKIFYKIYFENILPFLGKYIFHKGEFNSFKYLPESNKLFPIADELIEILKQQGLNNIQQYTYMGGAVLQLIAYA